MANVPKGFEWETVGLPLVQGVDLNTRARLVDSATLLLAENIAFPRDGGLEMRRGHASKVVKSSDPELGVFTEAKPTSHVFGYGLANSLTRDDSLPGTYSLWPDAGDILGLFNNDQETVAWNGYRAYRHSQRATFATVDNAIFPTAKSSVTAKSSLAQSNADAGDNGVIRVVAVKEGTVYYGYCYDSLSNSLLFRTELTTPNNTHNLVRVIPLADCIQVFISETTGPTLYLLNIYNGDNYTTFPSSQRYDLGQCASFDARKTNDSLTLVAKIDSAGAIQLMHTNAGGSYGGHFGVNKTIDLSTSIAAKVAVAQHPTTLDICVFWIADIGTGYARIYNSLANPLYARATLGSYTDVQHITVTPGGNLNGTGQSPFHLFRDSRPAIGAASIEYHIIYSSVTFLQKTRYNVSLASHAFTVGNLPFVFGMYVTTLQSQYFLLDDRLKPCGRLEYGTAVAPPTTWIPGVSTMGGYTFHAGFMYRVRVDAGSSFVFQEPSVKFHQLNFLPKFQSVQAGRCNYIPGAQLWQYDGRSFVEAGFHACPELDPTTTDVTRSTGDGSLTLLATYQWRIYVAHKNAKGEEVRSNAFFVATTMLGTQNTVALRIRSIPSVRDDAYFLVYRKEATGTLFYLVSDRDPASANCPKNDLTNTNGYVTFTDLLADSAIISRELDPANTENFLQSYSPPASELIAFGKDRVWLAGGEISPGVVYASRLFSDREAVTFHPSLYVDVDKSSDPVKAVNFNGDYTVIFKQNSSYIVSGQLPNNISQDGQTYTQMSLTDTGVLTEAFRHTFGIFFESEGGIRLLNASGMVEYVGRKVEPVTVGVNAIIACPKDRQLRFYQDSSCLTLDYESGQWATWTCGANAAVVNPVTGYAILAVGGSLWFETEGLYTDAARAYGFRIRSSWLSKQLGQFQRIRKVGAVGEYTGLTDVNISIYFDEAVAPYETVTWKAADNLNTSTWGSDSWGNGHWGDSGAATGEDPRDSIWRFVYRPGNQKCTAVSVEISYSGSTLGPIVTGLLFEIGVKQGMQKLQSTLTNVITPNHGNGVGNGGGGGA